MTPPTSATQPSDRDGILSDVDLETLSFAGIYLFSRAELRLIEERTRRRLADRSAGSADTPDQAPPLVPPSCLVYRGDGEPHYIAVVHDGGMKALQIRLERRFDPKHAALGGFIDLKELERLQRSSQQLVVSVAAMQRQVGQVASGLDARVPAEGAAPGESSADRGPTLASELTGVLRDQIQSMVGQGIASAMAGDALASSTASISSSGLAGLGMQKALGYGVSQLFSAWRVDDSSSAATQLSKMFLQQAVERLQSELQSSLFSSGDQGDPEAVQRFLGGAKPSLPLMPVAREADLTSHGGVLSSTATRTKINGRGPVRTLDMHTCPMCDGSTPHVGGPVREGNATIQVEGQFLSRMGHAAICTGVGAETKAVPSAESVFIGDVTCAVLPPPESKRDAQGGASSRLGSDAQSKSSQADAESDAKSASGTDAADSANEPGPAMRESLEKPLESGKATDEGATTIRQDGNVETEAPISDAALEKLMERLSDLPEARRRDLAQALKSRWSDVLRLERAMDSATTSTERMALLQEWGATLPELRDISDLERRWSSVASVSGSIGNALPFASAVRSLIKADGEVAAIARTDPQAAWRHAFVTGLQSVSSGVLSGIPALSRLPLWGDIGLGVAVDHAAGSLGTSAADATYDWAHEWAKRIDAWGWRPDHWRRR